MMSFNILFSVRKRELAIKIKAQLPSLFGFRSHTISATTNSLHMLCYGSFNYKDFICICILRFMTLFQEQWIKGLLYCRARVKDHVWDTMQTQHIYFTSWRLFDLSVRVWLGAWHGMNHGDCGVNVFILHKESYFKQ